MVVRPSSPTAYDTSTLADAIRLSTASLPNFTASPATTHCPKPNSCGATFRRAGMVCLSYFFFFLSCLSMGKNLRLVVRRSCTWKQMEAQEWHEPIVPMRPQHVNDATRPGAKTLFPRHWSILNDVDIRNLVIGLAVQYPH